jgi:hypothetical protein
MTPEDRRRFVIEHTTVGSAPLVPEIRLHIGGSSMPLWETAALADLRPAVPPPYSRIPQLERERVPMSRSVRAGGIDQPAAVAASTWGALSRT